MAYHKSIYTTVSDKVKAILGIKDFSLVRKNIHKSIGKLFYHQKYSATDIVNLMQKMGMKQGSLVCIHSSMKEFYNYQGTAEELIEKILDVIGTDGTLMMPAFPPRRLVTMPDYVFDKDNDPTGAGFLAETFRKYPGVRRSINVKHSVCAIGRHAEALTANHQNCHDCWGDGSPWMELCRMGGLVFNFGLPRSYMGTFHHCVESMLQYEHPYWKQFFTLKKVYRYKGEDNMIHEYETYESHLDRRTREKRVTKHFTSEDWCIRRISNLEIKVFYTDHCFPKMLELGRRGIGVYYIPSPKKYHWL